eukprot:Em0001g916a
MLDWHPSKVLGTNVYQQPVKLWDLRAGLSACKMCPYGAHPHLAVFWPCPQATVMCAKWKLADKHAARDHLIRHQRRCQQPQDEVRPYMDVYLVREGERRHPSSFYPDQPRQTHDRVMVWHTWSHPRQASATLVPGRSFSKLTGAGPTGLRIQHFIDAADVPLSCSILQFLKGVVNILVAGRAPPMIASFLAGGNLTALFKSMQDSSLDIRPIVDMKPESVKVRKMEKYLVPEPVGEGDLTDQWTRFKKEFNLFLLAIGKADASGGIKLAILLRAVGQRVNDIHEALVFAEGENKDDFDTVVQKLDSVCARRTSKHVIRDRFFQMKQDHRTIDQFVADLRKQVKDCEFGALKDDLMLHVLIRGVDSDRMRRRLFETDKLELPKAIQMCQTMEATSADLESWVGKEKKVDGEVPVECMLYIGHIISANGIRPDPAKVTAIQEMPEPAGVSDVRRFLGMCNYLSRYVPRLSEVSEPLRRLTEAEATFGWGVEEKSAFEKLKELISDQQRLAFYDVRKPVVIQCDASTVGLGAVLMQEGRPVASVSRSLSKSEKNYVAIELECLAIVFACQKFHQYIFGKKVRIETDHKPLEIIVRKPILSAPRRLQRMLLLLQRYSLEVVFRPGEQQVLADTLSRAPAGTTAISAPEEEMVFQLQIIKEHEFLPISDQRIAAIKSAAARDAEYAMLSKIIKQGWPQKIDHIPEAVRSYWNFRETMTVQDGIVYKGGQVVVPVEVRPDIVVRLHSSHQGIQSTLRRAQDVVYWPGMKKDIEKAVRRCAVCEENAPALPKEECRAHEIMGRLWEKVGMDLFHCRGKDFLIIVDYLTDFFEITELLECGYIQMEAHSSRPGNLQDFPRPGGFQHTLSSPYNSQSNGKAESAVKIAKRLMKRSTDPYLEWRNTPTIGMGSSPAQRLLSRRTRGAVPIASSKLHPEVQTHVLEKKEQKQHKMLQSSGGAKRRALPPLVTGKPILAQDMRAFKTQWKRGTCVSQLSDRSYIVDIEGQLVRRNRRFLKQSENPPGEGELVDKDEAIDGEVMREMGEGQTEQTLDKTTEQLGVDSSLNTEEDTVEPSTNAEQPGEPKAFTSSGNGANPGQVLRADGEGSSVYKTRSGRASRVPAKYRDYVKI